MANKRPKPGEIVTKLRQVEVRTGHGMPRLDATRQIGVTEQTYYRCSAGGVSKGPRGAFSRQTNTAECPARQGYAQHSPERGTDQLKELKRLQKENERLRRAVSDLTLDTLILAEAAKGVRSEQETIQ